MTDLSRPDEIRATSFSQARRGYDREEVDRFRDEVAVELAALIERVRALEAGGSALGIESAESLRLELATVSEDVAEVLAVAQEAAEGIRTRAAADAAAWRAAADQESRSLRDGAQRAAEQARNDAWETATELLSQAQAEADQMVATAADDALFIRAEAEREALRHTGDAKRDQEEILRSARSEADRTLDAARIESEEILEAARVSAETAQERARALERRRAELMEELEAARLSIGQLEQEIDTRREALATAADVPDSGVRVIGTGSEYQWHGDDTSVRLVPGHVVTVDQPVDADSLVAEVEALQRAIDAVGEPADEVDDTTGDTPRVAEREMPADTGGVGAREVVPEPEVVAAPEVVPEPEVVAVPEVVPEPGPVTVPDSEAIEGSEAAREPGPPSEPEREGAPGPPVEPVAGSRSNDIDTIFARLRVPASDAGDEIVTAMDQPPARVSRPERDREEQTREPLEPATVEDSNASDIAAVSPPAGAPALTSAGVDAFDLRDRLLLPIENRVLRSVKRRIVDLQNRVLEELRVGGDEWLPDRALLAQVIGDEMATLSAESHVAGHTAAADLTGSATTPRPSRGPSKDDSGAFVDGFAAAVVDALGRARSAGGGTRQIAAGVSRVFRAWRTDEAERRLRTSARRSYHEGVVAGLEVLGVERVMAVANGHPCGVCPAASGASWRPGDSLPPGTSLPPATPTCTATIVPAG